MVAIGSLVYMAAMPVLDIFIMASVGFLITKKGIMDKRIRQGLGQILFWVFVPCLTFSKLGRSLNFRDLAVWWILPVNMAYAIGAGLLVGYIVSRILRVEPWFRKIFMCVMALGNVGNLPIVLVQSVCSNDYPLFTKDLPGPQCEEKGIAYVAFSMWVASTFQFCVALNLMQKDDTKSTPDIEHQDSEALKGRPLEIAIEMSSPFGNTAKKVGSISEGSLIKEDGRSTANRSARSGEGGTELQSLHAVEDSQPHGQRYHLKVNDTAAEYSGRQDARGIGEEDDMDESRALVAPDQASSSHCRDERLQTDDVQLLSGSKSWRKKQKERLRWWRNLPWGKYLNMPTLAAAAGLSVGCISLLKDLLFGDTAPLGFLSQSISILAGAMIPTMMLLLGSGLSEGPGDSRLPLRVIIGTIVTRLFIMPAIGLGSFLIAQRLGIFHAPNSMFSLVLLINHCPPTALNLQTVAIINENGESEVATLICWQYIASLISVPIWMAIFLSILS